MYQALKLPANCLPRPPYLPTYPTDDNFTGTRSSACLAGAVRTVIGPFMR